MRLISRRPFWVKVGDAEFEIRILNAEEKAQLMEEIGFFQAKGGLGREQKEVEFSANAYKLNLSVCERGIVSWKGVKDENDKEIPYSKELVKYLPAEVLDFLSGKIFSQGGLTEKEAAELRD